MSEAVPASASVESRQAGGLTPGEVFRAHAADVGRWARRLGGPAIDADEIVQEVFVKVWESLGSFRGESQLTTWLFRITANEVARSRRRPLLQRLLGGEDEALAAEVPDDRPSALDGIERGEEIARLYRALDRLGEKYRVPLVLFEIEELSGERIAELLGIPVATVWVRLHRGRAKLVEALAELESEERRAHERRA